jgi:hypothetical protein
MFGWFKKRSRPSLASPEERNAILDKQHPLFRVVDTGFHAYMEIIAANPQSDDNQIEQELRGRGIEAGLAEDLVAFAPIAFGREVLQQLGVKYSDLYRLHSLTDGSEREMSFANEMAYAWARAMIGLYRTPERNEVFKLVATRSAELAAINNALHSGVPGDELSGGNLAPIIVNLRRSGSSDAEAPA